MRWAIRIAFLTALYFVVIVGLMSAQDAAPHARRFYRDGKWWAGEALIVATGVISGKAESHARQGGTRLFGACGSCTSNGDIAGIEAAGFAAATGLHVLSHHALMDSYDDLGAPWRWLAYVGVPVGYSVPLLYQASGNWAPAPAPAKVDMSKVEIVRR